MSYLFSFKKGDHELKLEVTNNQEIVLLLLVLQLVMFGLKQTKLPLIKQGF